MSRPSSPELVSMTIPTIDESFACRQRFGWSVGEVRLITSAGVVWLVDTVKAGHRIEVRAAGQAEAWQQAHLGRGRTSAASVPWPPARSPSSRCQRD
ncbi:MAG TPA: hypothetical protein VEL76_05005 [Gemmataceae bacterium]|nr:hypothetical protein [Gemmataceae bacterium]